LIFKNVHIFSKSLVMSVRLCARLSIEVSTCIRAYYTGRISTTFFYWRLLWKLSRKSKFL